MKKRTHKKHFFHTLSRKFLFGFFLLALAILTASCTIGYRVYSSNIRKIYNTHAYATACEARALLDGDALRHYAQTGKTDAGYEKMKASIEELRKNTGAIAIFVTQVDTPERGNYFYLIDTYADHEAEFPLGGVSNYPERHKKAIQSAYYDGADLSNTYIYENNDVYGANFFAIVPLYGSDGKIVANISVQTAIRQLHETLRQYLLYAISLTIVLVIIFLLLYLTYLNQKLISPLKKITRHASGFIQGNDMSGMMEKIHTGDEIELLADAIIQMEQDIRRYTDNLAAEAAAREHIAAEFNVAKQIQQNLFPYHYPAFPERKDFDVYAHLQSCRSIGGSFYNFFLLDDTHLCLFAGDVSGNGIPTSMFSAIAATLLQNYAALGLSPDRVLANANDELSKNNHAELTVDVFFAVVDLNAGQLTYVTAGNQIYALHKSPGSPFTHLPYKSCFPLATIGQVAYPVSTYTLSQGDILFLHTKGVAAAENSKGMLFGADYAKDTLYELLQREYSLKTLSDRFFESMDSFTEDTPQKSDSAILLFRYSGG